MVKMIQFPKNEYAHFLEAMSYYQKEDYTSAFHAFQRIHHLPHFRTLMTKPYVHTNIALKQFEKVYEWIEESLVIDGRNEDELIECYIYTMIQERRYGEAIELICIFLEAVDLSYDLRKALLKLKNTAMEYQKKDQIEARLSEIEFSYQQDMIDFILHMDQVSIETHESLIHDILQDPYVDPLVKIQLLDWLREKGYDKPVEYVNGMKERFMIHPLECTPITEMDSYLIPTQLADQLLKREAFVIDLKFIENIWLNEYMMIYPKVLKDHELIAFHLRDKVLYLMGEKQQLGHFLIE